MKTSLFLVIFITLCITNVAHAHSKADLLWVARACWIEAEFRANDCIATTWIAKKRAPILKVSWPQAMKMYSAIMKKNPRAAKARTFPWGNVSGMTVSFNEKWHALLELVKQIANNEHADPCPDAKHWGGTIDPQKSFMYKAQCKTSQITLSKLDIEPLANTFYGVKKK